MGKMKQKALRLISKAALANARKVVTYTVIFPHIYDGCTVEGHKLVVTVDGERVKYTTVNCSEIQG